MKTNSLLAKLSGFLSNDRHLQAEKHKSLKKILKALKHEKNTLKESLAETGDSEQKHEIETRLKIVSAQRKKGLAILRSLKKERKTQLSDQ